MSIFSHLFGRNIKNNEIGGTCGMYGERRVSWMVLVGKPKERIHLEFLGVDGRIILKCVSKKYAGRARTGFIYLRTGTVGRL